MFLNTKNKLYKEKRGEIILSKVNIRTAAAIIVIFAGILILAGFITGCEKKEKKDLLSVIKSRGKIIAGVKYDAKPFGFIDKNEKVSGFDIDLCREIAKRLLGDPNAIEFQQVTSSNRIFSITSGTVDFAAATMTITPGRQKIIDFSNPYYIAGQAIMVPAGSPIKSIGDLDGKKIIVVLGSTSEKNIREIVPNATVLGFRTYTDAFSALKNKRGDALTTDDTIIYGFISKNTGFIMLKERLTREPYGLGFRKGKETRNLEEAVNLILKNMAEDGTLTKLNEKWVGKMQ